MTKDNPEFTQAISRQAQKNHIQTSLPTHRYVWEINLKVKKQGRHQTFSCKIKTGTAGVDVLA